MSAVGSRVRLLAWGSDEALREDSVPHGTEGTVVAVEDDVNMIHVRWDTGLELGLIPEHDRWEEVAPSVTEVDRISKRAHVAALRAGNFCYIYSGSDRTEVAERARTGEVGMTAANLDTEVTWLQPQHFHETYQRLCDAVGYRNVYLMPSTEGNGAEAGP